MVYVSNHSTLALDTISVTPTTWAHSTIQVNFSVLHFQVSLLQVKLALALWATSKLTMERAPNHSLHITTAQR
jgi:hypothetical protein